MADEKLYAGQRFYDDMRTKFDLVAKEKDLGDKAIEALKGGDGIAKYLMAAKEILKTGKPEEQVELFREFPVKMDKLGHEVTQKTYDMANAAVKRIVQGNLDYKAKCDELEDLLRVHGVCADNIRDLTRERDGLLAQVRDADKYEIFVTAFQDGLERVLPEPIVGDAPIRPL